MIKHKIRGSDWLTFPLIIVNFNHFFIQPAPSVPQGSVLSSLLFLTYINDTTEKLETDCFLYPDNTSFHDVVDTSAMTSIKLNNDLNKIKELAQR